MSTPAPTFFGEVLKPGVFCETCNQAPEVSHRDNFDYTPETIVWTLRCEGVCVSRRVRRRDVAEDLDRGRQVWTMFVHHALASAVSHAWVLTDQMGEPPRLAMGAMSVPDDPFSYDVRVESPRLSGREIRARQRELRALEREVVARIDVEVVASLLGVDPALIPPQLTADLMRAENAAFRRRLFGEGETRQDSYWDLLYRDGRLEKLRREQEHAIRTRAANRAYQDQEYWRSPLINGSVAPNKAKAVRELRAIFAEDPTDGRWMVPDSYYLLMRRLKIVLADVVPKGKPFFEPTPGPHGNDAIPAMARTVGRLVADWPKATGRHRALGVR